MRCLALDVGEKRIGLATSDELGMGVWPQATLQRKGREEDLEALIQVIQDRSIQMLVVGLPYNMDGTEGPQARKVKSFVSQLKQALERKGIALPIEWCDERLTSWEAEKRLSEKGKKGKKRKEEVDAMAACLILEDYLERKKT
ncbi:MAG: Holliday junction resolvase RuvX [bacterium]